MALMGAEDPSQSIAGAVDGGAEEHGCSIETIQLVSSPSNGGKSTNEASSTRGKDPQDPASSSTERLRVLPSRSLKALQFVARSRVRFDARAYAAFAREQSEMLQTPSRMLRKASCVETGENAFGYGFMSWCMPWSATWLMWCSIFWIEALLDAFAGQVECTWNTEDSSFQGCHHIEAAVLVASNRTSVWPVHEPPTAMTSGLGPRGALCLIIALLILDTAVGWFMIRGIFLRSHLSLRAARRNCELMGIAVAMLVAAVGAFVLVALLPSSYGRLRHLHESGDTTSMLAEFDPALAAVYAQTAGETHLFVLVCIAPALFVDRQTATPISADCLQRRRSDTMLGITASVVVMVSMLFFRCALAMHAPVNANAGQVFMAQVCCWVVVCRLRA